MFDGVDEWSLASFQAAFSILKLGGEKKQPGTYYNQCVPGHSLLSQF